MFKMFEEKYEGQVYDLLRLCDNEFTPPLSARNSTTQGNLRSGSADGEPIEYFKAMKGQDILLNVKDEIVVGFISYVRKGTINYVSTIIIHPDWRNRGLAEGMYRHLLYKSDVPIETRTWSTNYAHLHVLEKLGFELETVKKNDRGEGIDTVYYIKRV